MDGGALASSGSELRESELLNVCVSGGSSGIGRQIVQSLSAIGHRVLFTYYSNESSARELEKSYPTATAVYCDQGELSSICSLYESALLWLNGSPLHVLINNAALGSASVLSYSNTDASLAHFSTDTASAASLSCSPHLRALRSQAVLDEALLRVNALGPLWMTDALLPLLRPCGRDSVVIIVGSVGGSTSAVFPEYTASDLMSKAAVGYFAKHLAAAHMHDHLNVFCLSPGATETDMFRCSTLNKMSDAASFVRSMPKGTLIQPSEIADCIVWLCSSPSARVFHGAVLDASLGLSVRPGLQTENRHAK